MSLDALHGGSAILMCHCRTWRHGGDFCTEDATFHNTSGSSSYCLVVDEVGRCGDVQAPTPTLTLRVRVFDLPDAASVSEGRGTRG